MDAMRRRIKYLEKIIQSNNNEDVMQMKKSQIKKYNKKIKNEKSNLKKLIQENNEKDFIRSLKVSAITERNVISTFESTLTRSLNLQHDDLTENLIVVETFYFQVLEDIINKGFVHNGDKYVIYTASAGQIRTKKTVFIKESELKKIKNKLMAGLTEDMINKKGGVNTNKFLAYLALNNSSTDLWEGFDIDRCIVVDDLETNVSSMVDYIDTESYKIERKEMDVPIEHTDGCGMILPSLTKRKGRMVRAPWIKGLLMPFPFDTFVRKHKSSSIVKDVYGDEYDILKDNINVIFTKSQFKMWKYYDNWESYKENFKKYNCEVGYCNEEPDKFKNSIFNYQMLQTLSDMTYDELKELSSQTQADINEIVSDRNIMFKSFGVTPGDFVKDHSYAQQSLSLYPELITDKHFKKRIYDIRRSMVNKAKAGKFEVDGTYTFISPDLYAFCEYLFLGHKNPKGLLKENEVFCNIYKEKDKLDCLRAPHLYREHAVRFNISKNNERFKEVRKWFVTNSVYMNIHDATSKILQFDVDGDTSLVVANDLIIKIAERNMKDIVPLYYDMAKAGSNQLNSAEIYKGIIAAYTGGNIGQISNDITKIWNSGDIGEDELEAIKLLTMENNFVIDYAKTLFKLKRPDDKHKLIKKYTKKKVPYFFKYVKGKKDNQVEPLNDLLVNRLEKIIVSPNISIKNIAMKKFDYKMLMSDKGDNNEVNLDVVDMYDDLNNSKKFLIGRIRKIAGDNKSFATDYIYRMIRNRMVKRFESIDYVVDNLITYLFSLKESKSKDTFWYCFGDVVVKNLKQNIENPLDNGYILCEECGERVKIISARTRYCQECSKKKEAESNRVYARKSMKKIRDSKKC